MHTKNKYYKRGDWAKQSEAARRRVGAMWRGETTRAGAMMGDVCRHPLPASAAASVFIAPAHLCSYSYIYIYIYALAS